MYERRLIGICAVSFLLTSFVFSTMNCQDVAENSKEASSIEETEIIYTEVSHAVLNEEEEEIRDEIMYGEMEMLAQLIQAEAGNQDEMGKRYVADVVLNRVSDRNFPDKVEDVILQDNQFSVVYNGAFDKAGWEISDESFKVSMEEYQHRTNTNILYFRTDRYSDSGHPAFKHGDHYFSTR